MGHPKDNGKVWIGLKRPEGLKRTGFKRNSEPIRKVSPKQRRRNVDWAEKARIYKAEQVRLFGTPFCEMARGFPSQKCYGELEADHVIPRGRHPENVDGYWNMQMGCHGHHFLKTSTPGMGDKDFRSRAMKEAAKELDAKG